MTDTSGDRDRPRVAAFDVDGTLTTADCVVPFLRRTVGTPTLVRRMLGSPLSLARAGVRRDRDALKAASATATFRGLSLAAVEADAAVVLVSASFEVYLRPLAELLGAHDVLAVRLEVDDDRRLTGGLDGANCRGREKIVRLHDWLDLHAGGRSGVHLTAYGDSHGDRELLADADVAHWVGRGEMPR